jgi:hypothetical protein
MKVHDNVVLDTGEWGTIVHIYLDGLTAEVELICSHTMIGYDVVTLPLKNLRGKNGP